MAPLVIDGGTLGERHESFNKIVEERIKNYDQSKLTGINYEDDDVVNLMKIDIASHHHNVDYIFDVLKCEDMLYVSRAIMQSKWLIIDEKYSHYINPEYLNTKLYPEMSVKAIKKFTMQIILILKDESRNEDFFKYYEENNFNKALKWLPNCSVEFIKQIICKHHKKISMALLARLCERSFSILKVYSELKICAIEIKNIMIKVGLQYLKSNPDQFLNIFECLDHTYNIRQVNIKHPLLFSKHASEIIVKNHYTRIIEKFDKYAHHLDMPVFAKYLKEKDAKDFVLQLAGKESYSIRNWFGYEKLKYLVERIPETERFDFVKQVFIDKIHDNKDIIIPLECLRDAMKKLCGYFPRVEFYRWYTFAPFNIAFNELRKLINCKSFSNNKGVLFDVLFDCTKNNMEYIKKLLQYFHDQHMKDSEDLKCEIIGKFLSQTDFIKYDDNTWNYLDNLFRSVKVYTESDSENQTFIEAIVVYNIAHNKKVPEVIEKKFDCNSLDQYSDKLSHQEKDKVFQYVYNHLLIKMEKHSVTNQSSFEEAVEITESILNLINTWKKELKDHPIIQQEIKKLIEIKKHNSWDNNLSNLYNINKTWRKLMFEDSLLLRPCEEACINAIKHNTELLKQNEKEVEALTVNDKVSLHRLLCKMRIYWPESLAKEWKIVYIRQLQQLAGHKALTRGICTLLPKQEAIDIINKYVPINPKINWNEIDEVLLSVQRHLAKNMHFCRPQVPADTVLQYAKGDYLQYALPSLHAVFHNLSIVRSHDEIPKMFSAPVSLQKHGIRFAFVKMQPEELKEAFSGIWKTSKNSTIRAVIFKFTFDLLCREKTDSKIQDLWQLLSVFIDNLSFEEDKKIYDLLNEVEKIPLSVRAEFLKKSYKFLKSFILNDAKNEEKYGWNVRRLARYTRDIMDLMDSDFVAELILEYIKEGYFGKAKTYHSHDDIIQTIISPYLLSAKDDECQIQRFNKTMTPLLEYTFDNWGKSDDTEFSVRVNFFSLLKQIAKDVVEYSLNKKRTISMRMFSEIQKRFENLPPSENYILLCLWKLTTGLTSVFNKYLQQSGDFDEQTAKKECSKGILEFGEICLQYLKEDIKTYFPCIYSLFCHALRYTIEELPDLMQLEIYECLLADKEFIPGYLAMIQLMAPVSTQYYGSETDSNLKLKELHPLVYNHPSVEVKMHYYCKFKNET